MAFLSDLGIFSLTTGVSMSSRSRVNFDDLMRHPPADFS